MYSIGAVSKKTGVKVPTIRYYEQIGLLIEPDRSMGNQRRYSNNEIQQLSFIKHARELGFSLEAISSLIELQLHPDTSCKEATAIAESQLTDVRAKIKQLKTLERELKRISSGCDGEGLSGDCYVLSSLADHRLCAADHAQK